MIDTIPKPFSLEAEWSGEQCRHIAQEGSLAWGNRCILRRHKDEAHVYGTPQWRRNVVNGKALADVVEERCRQIGEEGRTASSDDEYKTEALAIAAACYALPPGMRQMTELSAPWGWPWDASWWKPGPRRRDLVKACSLMLAEIDRIDRAAFVPAGKPKSPTTDGR